ncbi:sialate O-acetylesterase [Levilactobacillus enshiensis]|uniref:sialate O-acetylesterase n=1 Tax=Levilactobacillus enshiensis TaxID=2590213 RepID=UPI00117B1559|nr:sialate O-acetylesterase [Levilactobacillus enshiensis]
MGKKIFIPYLLRDGVVLQRNKPLRFWGHAPRDSSVKLIFGDDSILTAQATNKGYFEFHIKPHEAGGPFTIRIETQDDQVIVHDVLVGDAWLLSGQSNMQLWMERLKTRYPKAIQDASNPKIRFFEVPQHFNFSTQESELASGEWKTAVAPDLKGLSGIGYFFAQQQYAKNHVPVGLISTAIGGTRVRSWVSRQTLQRLEELPEDFDRLNNSEFVETVQRDDEEYQDQFLKTMDETDQGIGTWSLSNCDDTNWQEARLNHQLPEAFRYPGVVWLRKEVQVPPEMVGSLAQLRLGTFTDADETFIDGQLVGHIDYQYPPREYEIGKLKSKFELVIRLKIFNYPGGVRHGKKHLIVTDQGTLDLDEQGPWKIARGNWMPERKDQVFLQYEPVGLFNGMIAPLGKATVAGILWYQGESDTGNPNGYGKVFKALISEWRHLFQDDELPFLYVQLPNCGIEPEHEWAAIRQEQLQGMQLMHTGMVVSLGLGEDNDLHPTNKQSVAQRLSEALNELKRVPDGYCTGPLANRAYHIHQRLRIQFKTFGHAIVLSDEPEFEILFQNKWWSIHGGEVDGQQIEVTIPEEIDLGNVQRVRYGWGNTPATTIINDVNSPASPFCLKLNK